MKVAILGAGLMGRAALFDVAQQTDVEQVGIVDIDQELAADIGVRYGNGKAVAGKLDAGDEAAATELLNEYDTAVSCVCSYLTDDIVLYWYYCW